MASRNPKYPRPSIDEAVKIHKLAQELGQPIPHFFDDDGVLFYLDRNGKKAGGNQYFRNLGAKLSAEAKRKALKNKRTPTLDLYTRVYGEKTGTDLYKTEQAKLKHIYTTTPTATHDVDHINSMASGGVHHSRNLRPQESALNRSEGARGLTPEAKNALMLADDVEDQIRLQGPPVISRIRDQIASNHMPRAFNRASVLRGMNANIMGVLPEVFEIVDSKTDGALSEGINSTVDKGKQLVTDGFNGWKNILTSMVGQGMRDTNYGQY